MASVLKLKSNVYAEAAGEAVSANGSGRRHMKILHVNAFHGTGGAARAAMRLHQGLLNFGIDSHYVTITPGSNQGELNTPLNSWQLAAASAKRRAAAGILKLQVTPTNTVLHSLGRFSSGLGPWISATDFDVVNLHWICAEALSVQEIAEIQKPLVWTMHDMWPLMGAEHYDDLTFPERWKSPYTASNRPPNYQGLDVDRYVWARKAKLWGGKTFELVAPSRWLATCARDSALMGHQPCQVIHNPIDTSIFRPLAKDLARRALGLKPSSHMILFGAMDATSDERKGFDLLMEALQIIQGKGAGALEAEVVVFGSNKPLPLPSGMRGHFLGAFESDEALRTVYSAADVFVAPSRQDNLPNTVVEAAACGVPTVAFDIGGMSDIIIKGATGVLIQPFDTGALANGILQLLSAPLNRDYIRQSAVDRFSLDATIPTYLAMYRSVILRRAQEERRRR